VAAAPSGRPADYLAIAATAASVGFRAPLSEEQLLRALLTGVVPENRKPHLRRLLEDSPTELVRNLASQVGAWAKAGRVEKNLTAIAKALDVKGEPWTKSG